VSHTDQAAAGREPRVSRGCAPLGWRRGRRTLATSQATRTIKVGTGVALIQQRDTIQTAKLVASIDQVSQGRFLFGVGGGWNQDEMEDHGTVYATRFKRVREIDRGDEGNLDEGDSGISRRIHQFRSDDRPAQTGPETASADPRRRRFPAWRTARHPLWRWLGSRRRYPRGPTRRVTRLVGDAAFRPILS